MDKNMLNSLLRSSGKGTLPSIASGNTEPRKSMQSSSSYISNLWQQDPEEIDDNTLDISRSNKIYDSYLSNLENVLNVSPTIYKRKLNALQNEIDSPGLHPFETDRLLLLKGILNLFYFDEHYLDEDFDDNTEQYYSVIDEVDNLIDEMSDVTEEAWYLYYVANMFSIDRFKDAEPLDKLDELWAKITSIKLKDEETEWKVSFWVETAKRIHDMMERIYTPDSEPPRSSISCSHASNNSHHTGMRINSDLCLECGTCKSVCPTDSISSGTVYRIDADTCIECGSCAAVCPVDAIF